MSFIKVKDPRKREELIRDFIETRKRIKDNFIAKKVGEAEYQTGLTKLFKPVTETQKATAKETAEKFTQELLPIKESLEKIPAITFPAFPAIEMTEEEKTNLGPIATNALKKFLRRDDADKIYGLRDKNGKFYIGNKLAVIDNNDLIVGKYEYEGTPGLWELITSKNPDKSKYGEEDLEIYAKLLIRSNALRRNYDPDNKRPLSSPGNKWKKLLSPIWKNKHLFKEEEAEEEEEDDDPQPSTSGTGLSVAGPATPRSEGLRGTGLPKILPSDPNALIDRFDLLFSSKKAGHTGVRNEIVSILDELKRQGVLKTNEYKKLNSLIKK